MILNKVMVLAFLQLLKCQCVTLLYVLLVNVNVTLFLAVILNIFISL